MRHSNSDCGFVDSLQNALNQLYPYKIGSKGQLLEWYEEYEEEEPHHRHISHLYGLHPSNEITLEDTPELAKACEVSLNLRGDDGTGWSLGWKINQWARLKDGDHALKLLKRQLRVVEDTEFDYSRGGGTYINLLDAHPPFQIDGNFAATAGIAEMLLQSRGDKLFLLPDIPTEWKRGSVKGLCAKGGIHVNIEWDENHVKAKSISAAYRTVFVSVKVLIDFGEKHVKNDVKIDYFAVSLPDLSIFDQDLNESNKAHCYYLMGLGKLGLKAFDEARET